MRRGLFYVYINAYFLLLACNFRTKQKTEKIELDKNEVMIMINQIFVFIFCWYNIYL